MGWAALSELVPYYPLYALLFLDTGLSGAQVSALFAIWSITALVTEVPAGALADRWSRRGAVVLASLLQAAAFVVWTAAPGFWAFAVGFVIGGVGGAFVSGASEALVHDELAAVGAEASFGRVYGWMTSAELLVQVPTAFAASGLFTLGGYELVGWASVVACLAAAVLATRFPEAPRLPHDGEALPLRAAVVDALRRPALRLALPAVALIGGLDAVEEYFPVFAGEQGVTVALVPVVVLGIALAGAAGAALGGHLPSRAIPVVLGVAGLGLLVASVLPGVPALGAAALFYALYLAVLVAAEAQLQARISGPYRATITSVAGLAVETAALLVFAAWALGGAGAVAVLVLAVVPVAALGLRVPASGLPADDRAG
ncbi:MAG: MFS transporter [Actinomycetes bacterium]